MTVSDTHPDIEARMDARYRAMRPTEKVAHAQALTKLGYDLALAGLRAKYPEASERELRLRLCSRWMTRELMIAAFGWDPAAPRP